MSPQEVKESIIRNLTNSEYDYRSYITYSAGPVVINRCDLFFPGESWDWARIDQRDFLYVLNSMHDNFYNFLFKVMTHNDLSFKEIHFTSLWRPFATSPSSPHLTGRGVDIRYIRGVNDQEVMYKINPSGKESPFAKVIRDIIYGLEEVTQFLSPWQVCGYDRKNPNRPSAINTCQINENMDPTERGHRDHLHITIAR